MSNPGTAAIWWRVSTDDQKEISPETQINEARALAIEEGLETPEIYVIGTDWHSLSVWDSPAMLQLRSLITQGAISAVVMYDADRGRSKPAHRLMMRALCEENGVRILCRYGQVPDGEMGEVMEFLSAWSKEKQVHRAQQGARDGLRDRAKIKGLPVNGNTPYGYRLRKELRGDQKVPVAIEPDPATHFVAARIWKMAVDGVPLRRICAQLIEDGIPSAKGGLWAAGTLHGMLRNPVYGGRYYALRYESKLPERRMKDTYGKSSIKDIPRDQWYLLQDFRIIEPVVTWEEWEAVQDRLALNKLNSPRNAKQFYMLSGLIFCGEDGRRLRGLSKQGKKYFYYSCTLRPGHTPGQPRCSLGGIRGREVEEAVWENVSAFLGDPQTLMAEMNRRRDGQGDSATQVRETVERLQRKIKDVDAMETDLVGMKLRGEASETAFERQSALLRAERTHYIDELERQGEAVKAVEETEAALNSIEQLREQIINKLETATPEDRRWALQALNTRVTHDKNGVEVSIGVPSHFESATVSVAPGFSGRSPAPSRRRIQHLRGGPHRRWIERM